MAVSVVKRPKGFIMVAENPAPIINFNGFARVVSNGHGLTTDLSFVYLKTEVSAYNGFWSVTTIDANNFLIKDYTGATPVGYIKDTTGTYTTLGEHAWNCAHLPIVYKLSNTLWPANSVDTIRTISSVTDSNGYCALSLSGDIKSTGSAAALEFVKVTVASDEDVDGVWQIIAYTNDTTFVIDVPYTALNAINLTNANIQYYYNNYHVKVQVWGGLNNGHEYYAQKPYELISTLDLIPDVNNLIVFSVSEILKKQIEIRNNLLLGTLPNNLDAFTQFFIKYAEVYDDSDGTTLTLTTPSYTSDLTNFEGRAVNSILAFKNIHSGAMSEYLLNTSNTGLFLTSFDTPTIFDGYYFDIGFLWDGVQKVFFKLQWYINGVLTATTYDEDIDNFYTGVYRVPIEADCDYDRVDVTALMVGSYNFPPSGWSNSVVDPAFDSRTATQFIRSNMLAGFQSAVKALVVATTETVKLQLSVTIAGGGLGSVIVMLTEATETSIYAIQTQSGIPTGTTILNFELTPSSPSTVIRIRTGLDAGSTMQITAPEYLFVMGGAVSETKTIDINCKCLQAQATGFYLSWQNNTGHFDNWLFTAYADHIIDIVDSGETEENTFPEWPNSYGEFADTIRKQTFRTSRKQALVRSQHLTLDQLDAIKYIKTSPLVQIVNSIYDRRTVIVDTDSFTEYREEDKLYQISFTITYTDDVPSQRV